MRGEEAEEGEVVGAFLVKGGIEGLRPAPSPGARTGATEWSAIRPCDAGITPNLHRMALRLQSSLWLLVKQLQVALN